MKSLVVLCVWLAAGAVARAGELEISAAGGGAASSREGDGALLSGGRIGFRFDEHLTVSVESYGGYAAGPAPAVPLEGAAAAPAPDRRLLTGLGADAQLSLPLGRLRPYARAGLVHQQERRFSSFADDPLSTLLGTADDARRRTGLSLGAGGALQLWRHAGVEVFGTWEVSALLFPDHRGPRAYAGAMAGLGAAFDLQ